MVCIVCAVWRQISSMSGGASTRSSVSCVVVGVRSFNHPQPPAIHAGAAEVLLPPRSLTRQLRHSHALRPPPSRLRNFQSFCSHSEVQ